MVSDLKKAVEKFSTGKQLKIMIRKQKNTSNKEGIEYKLNHLINIHILYFHVTFVTRTNYYKHVCLY